MSVITKYFLLGLTILLPVVLSIEIVVWIVELVEAWLKPIWLVVVPEKFYFPGLAIVTFMLLATMIGASSRWSVVNRLWELPGRLLERLPVVQYIYNMLKDFVGLVGGDSFSGQSVVWVTLPGMNSRLLGIVTRKGNDGSKLAGHMHDNEVAVYLPMSYQAGGYMLVLPAEQVTDADMEPGEALSLIMSAGLGQGSTNKSK